MDVLCICAQFQTAITGSLMRCLSKSRPLLDGGLGI